MHRTKEPDFKLSLEQAAEQALWDLRQWVKDHGKGCPCFTCQESISDLEKALPQEKICPGRAPSRY